jgi:high-affinity K+ transport system ATPase subunit B
MEFSKKLIIIVLVWTMGLVTFSFYLAFIDKNVNEAVTLALISTIIGSIVSYMVYQAKLKISRNKYHVDQNGKPYNIEEEGTTI